MGRGNSLKRQTLKNAILRWKLMCWSQSLILYSLNGCELQSLVFPGITRSLKFELSWHAYYLCFWSKVVATDTLLSIMSEGEICKKILPSYFAEVSSVECSLQSLKG